MTESLRQFCRVLGQLASKPLFWAFVLPPFLFFGWVAVGSQSIGNDYLSGHLYEPVMYRYYRDMGIEPMWDPIRTGGIPFAGNPSTQFFHFPRWVMMHLPGFLSGKATSVQAFKHILLLAFTHFLAFFVLRRLAPLEKLAAYFLAFLATYNLATLDSFRYGIALDTFTYGNAAILLSFLFLVERVSWPLPAIAGFTQLAISSGYYPTLPFLGLVGGLGAFVVLAYRRQPIGASVQRLGLLAFAAFLGLLMSAPSWLPLTELMAINYRRNLKVDLSWANLAPLEPLSLVFNFFRPWGAEVHSGFGASTALPLILVAAVGHLALSPVHWPLIGLLAFPFLYSMGSRGRVFDFFFHYVPGFKPIRVPGRLMVFMPTILISILGAVRPRLEKRWLFQASAVLNGGLLLWVLWLQLKYPMTGWRGRPTWTNSPEMLVPEFWDQSTRITWIVLGLAACAAFFRSTLATSRWLVAGLIFAFAQTAMVVSHGTWRREKPVSMTREYLEKFEHMPVYSGGDGMGAGADAAEGFASIDYVRFAHAAGPAINCYFPLNWDHKDVGVQLPFYLTRNLSCLESREAVYEAIRSRPSCGAGARTITYLSGPHSLCAEAAPPSRGNAELLELNAANRLVAVTPNLMRLEVESPRSALLATRYPLVNGNWQAFVDDKPAKIVRVNGSFVGVEVPPGRHSILVRYHSELFLLAYRLAFLGIALLALFCIWLWRASMDRKRIWTLTMLALGVSFGACTVQEALLRTDAKREILLNNSYAERLQDQLARWQGRAK